MLLTIDAGNTNAVFALVKDLEVLHSWRISSRDSRTADEYAVWLRQLMTFAGVHPGNIQACIICSVRPGLTPILKQLCHDHFEAPLWVVGETPLESIMAVDVDPGTFVGADRLVNAYAVKTLGLTPSIIIDFGTATTFDVVAHGGRYCGGIIAPGHDLSVKALADAAAHLPHISITRPPSVIGRNTVDAMRSGVFWGYISLIEGLVKRLYEELEADVTAGKKPLLVFTGGLATQFIEGSGLPVNHHQPDLTVTGLAYIYRDRCKTL